MVRDLRNLGRQTAFFAGRGKRKDAVAVKRIARRCKVSGTVWRCLRGQPASERAPLVVLLQAMSASKMWDCWRLRPPRIPFNLLSFPDFVPPPSFLPPTLAGSSSSS